MIDSHVSEIELLIKNVRGRASIIYYNINIDLTDLLVQRI